MKPDYMYERKIVDRVHDTTGLLLQGCSVPGRLRNAYEFTRDVARALAADGWGLRLKSIGLAMDQCSIDSIVHIDRGEVALVVRNAGSEHMMPCFEVLDAHAANQWVDPIDPEKHPRNMTLRDYDVAEIVHELHRVEAWLDRLTPYGVPDTSRALTSGPALVARPELNGAPHADT